MARQGVVFVCAQCGGETPKWQGQCPHCGEWNTLSAAAAPAATPASRRNAPSGKARPAAAQTLASGTGADAQRQATGSAELDRVLGGGLVSGSVTLIGGDPGIGKSTLLLQVAAAVAANKTVVYASGEESSHQVGLRAARLGLNAPALQVAAETDLDAVLALAQASGSALLVVDSIQTATLDAVDSAAGSVSQLRECAGALVRFAKRSGTAVIMIGHVTKEGAIAGPRVLEHLVDTVLYFESDHGSRHRLVRATKNRFGAVNELAFFVMAGNGLREVRNPSAIFLARSDQPAAGSIVTVTRDGGRPLLVELQALVEQMRFGNPRRVAQGLDSNRVAMLLAVLNRHGGVSLQDHDVFANVVGGLDIVETAWDLPLLLALVSSLQDKPLPLSLVAFGEIGLTGEVRPIAYGEERLHEAAKQGFRMAIVPAGNLPRAPIDGLEVRGVARLSEALSAASRAPS